ncbi:unnamed protein product [Ceratitis capitata]|uniref:(Mediterranean fruit fly) hypothetical protein n=1 Tax=Ceratitis capitata TaxID=7213 RepID=A0A811TYS1_CERCA|nr:unnamed protein product [Ceratitis capitata]
MDRRTKTRTLAFREAILHGIYAINDNAIRTAVVGTPSPGTANIFDIFKLAIRSFGVGHVSTQIFATWRPCQLALQMLQPLNYPLDFGSLSVRLRCSHCCNLLKFYFRVHRWYLWLQLLCENCQMKQINTSGGTRFWLWIESFLLKPFIGLHKAFVQSKASALCFFSNFKLPSNL